MLRPKTLCQLSLWIAFVLLSLNPLALALEPDDSESGSVEQLRSLLRSIDPYHAKETVSGKIQLFGSGAMDGLAHGWGDNFRGFHPDIEIEVSTLPEQKAAERFVAEPTGIWLLARPVHEEELEALKSKGLRDPVALEVGRQALGVFVHASNPAQSISGEQMRAIFTDNGTQVPTWRLLGAGGELAGKSINIVARQGSSGTQRFLQDVVFGTKLREGSTVESNARVIDAIKNDPLAIGICDLRRGDAQARPLRLQAGGNTIPSDDLAILTGQYPLVRPLSIIIDLGQTDNRNVHELVRYILSQAGQAENVLAGYFPIDLPLIRAELVRLQAK